MSIKIGDKKLKVKQDTNDNEVNLFDTEDVEVKDDNTDIFTQREETDNPKKRKMIEQTNSNQPKAQTIKADTNYQQSYNKFLTYLGINKKDPWKGLYELKCKLMSKRLFEYGGDTMVLKFEDPDGGLSAWFEHFTIVERDYKIVSTYVLGKEYDDYKDENITLLKTKIGFSMQKLISRTQVNIDILRKYREVYPEPELSYDEFCKVIQRYWMGKSTSNTFSEFTNGKNNTNYSYEDPREFFEEYKKVCHNNCTFNTNEYF